MPSASRSVCVHRRACRAGEVGRPSRPALEGRVRPRLELEGEARVVVVGGRALGGTGGDRRVRRRGVDRPGPGRRGRVGVVGLVGRADREGVGAVGEVGVVLRRRAGREGAAVELALEARVGLVGAEGEARVVVVGGRALGGAGGDRRLGRVVVDDRGVDRPGPGRRGRVDVAGLVDRADREGVGAVGEVGVVLRRRAGREGAAVELALEARVGLVGAEGEARVVVVGGRALGGTGGRSSSRAGRCRPSPQRCMKPGAGSSTGSDR